MGNWRAPCKPIRARGRAQDARQSWSMRYTREILAGRSETRLGGHGGVTPLLSATTFPLLSELLTEGETGSSIIPARATIRSVLKIRFISGNLLAAHFLARGLEATGNGKFVHETEQGQEWQPGNRLIGTGG